MSTNCKQVNQKQVNQKQVNQIANKNNQLLFDRPMRAWRRGIGPFEIVYFFERISHQGHI